MKEIVLSNTLTYFNFIFAGIAALLILVGAFRELTFLPVIILNMIERGKDADIIVVSNLPMNSEVIEGCKNLKLLSVAFTGVDHIAMDSIQ